MSHGFEMTSNKSDMVAGSELLSRLLKMRSTDEDESVGEAINDKQAAVSSGQPSWMRALRTTASDYLKSLVEILAGMDSTCHNISDPLYRFFAREIKLGQDLLRVIRRDLTDLVSVCDGEVKQTNHLRQLIHEITTGTSFFFMFHGCPTWFPQLIACLMLNNRIHSESLEEVQSQPKHVAFAMDLQLQQSDSTTHAHLDLE